MKSEEEPEESEIDSEDEKDTHVFTEDEDESENDDDDEFFGNEFIDDPLVDNCLYPWKGSKASMFEDVELLTEELR